ncbi:hydrogen peroxide-dependent heme synthase [Microbacterium sp. NPDC078428]|uniref:hydrogen peroxide-dependent heme synthase n=1 Tax=Microbacterium sp. NPDC078428 TaxID=3364190 RepID=UPI0037CC0549
MTHSGIPDADRAPASSPSESEAPQGFTLWAVWRRNPDAPVTETGATELEDIVRLIEEGGVTVRGFYDVSGLRADADLMVWLHGDTAEDLQRDLRRLRRTELLKHLLPTWNAMGVHRDAEFNRQHVPGFLRGIPPREWLCLYPFVRSYEWYLLPEEERGRMLAEHGRKGAAFRGVLANTVASFALGDYEWLLPLEADDVVDLVDLMRDLRATDARRHVREEVPFFTGRRLRLDEVPEVLQ